MPVAGTQSSKGFHRETSPTGKNYKAHLERPRVNGELATREARRIKNKGRKSSGFEKESKETDLVDKITVDEMRNLMDRLRSR